MSYKNCIQLAACAAGQALPMNPELPADLFTACLTTPVKMAMKWFVLRERTRVAPHDVHDLIDKLIIILYYEIHYNKTQYKVSQNLDIPPGSQGR